jgi:hypothetical protein
MTFTGKTQKNHGNPSRDLNSRPVKYILVDKFERRDHVGDLNVGENFKMFIKKI